jgi:hypothetical protein
VIFRQVAQLIGFWHVYLKTGTILLKSGAIISLKEIKSGITAFPYARGSYFDSNYVNFSFFSTVIQINGTVHPLNIYIKGRALSWPRHVPPLKLPKFIYYDAPPKRRALLLKKVPVHAGVRVRGRTDLPLPISILRRPGFSQR